MTWSSVPAASRAYLGIGDDTLDLWLNMGPIAYCISVFFASWVLLSRPDGLRVSVLGGSALCLLASIARCAPLLPGFVAGAPWALVLVGTGQFLNAAVAPLVVASPSYLSLIWFPEGQRNLATAIGNVSNAVGRGVGFFLGPALVSVAGDLPRLLLLEVGLAALPFVACMLLYPALPAVPPSPAAAKEMAKLSALLEGAGGAMEEREEEGSAALLAEEEEEGALSKGARARARRPSLLSLLRASLLAASRDVLACLRSPSVLLVTLSGGLQMAVYGAWSGTLPSVLSPRFSPAQAGALGSINTFIGVAGGLLAGALTDAPALRTRLVAIIQLLCLLAAGAFGVLGAALGPAALAPLAPAADGSGGLSFAALVALCGLAGALRGGVDPLFFELSAEVAHPVPAGTSGGVLTLVYHLILVVCLSLPPGAMNWSMVAMAAALLMSAAMLLPLKVEYVRR